MDIIKEIQVILDENERLVKENVNLKNICDKLKAREKLYMSELQKTKNQLERLAKAIDTTPHSSDIEYSERFYTSEECEG